MPKALIPAPLRFWRKVDMQGPTTPYAAGRCWQWTAGCDDDGYGAFRSSPVRVVRAYRYAYETLVGPVPPGLVIDHLCRNRRCVCPDHMETVTQGENVRRGDSFASRNRAKTHCPQGHPYAEENTYRARDGGRKCRTCARERMRRRYRETRAAA